MVDFATLRMGVETSALVKGERALDAMARAGERTETRIDGAMDGVGASAEQAATRVGAAAARMDGATRAATTNLTFQLNDIAQMLAAGQSPFMLAMQQGGQVAGAIDDLRGRVGILRGIGMAFGSLLSPVNLVTFGVIGLGAAAVQHFTAAGDAAAGASRDIDMMDEAIRRVSSQLSGVETAARDVEDATKRYNEALAVANSLQGGAAGYITILGQEISARRELLAIEQARLEYDRLNLQQSISASKAKIDALFAEVRLSQETYLAANAGRLTEQEIAQIKAEQLGTIQRIIAENQGLFLSQREQQATLNLINSVLAQNTGEILSQKSAVDQATDAMKEQPALVRQTRDAASGLSGLLNDAAGAASNLAAQLANAARALPVVGGSIGGFIDRVSGIAGSIGGALSNALSSAGSGLRNFATRMTDVASAAGSGRGSSGGGAARAIDEATLAAIELREEMNRPMISAIDGVSNAFGTFIANGLSDFKGFTKSIINSFKGMIAQMIATAASNRIMIGLGIGGGVGGIGGAASAATGLMGGGGGLLGLGGLGGAASGLWSGLSGVLSGGGLGSSFANLGGLLSGSVGGLGAIGAAIPALGAIGLVAGLFSKKTKLLDEGLTLNANEWGGQANSFNTKQTSRFFGLSKKTSTTIGPNIPEVSGAIGTMQAEIASMAKYLGVGAEAFKGFSYTVNLSLKGLTEDQRAAKVAEEIAKMGDAYAAMIPGVKSVNELLAITQQRYDLETLVLQLQGNTAELRRRELETINPLNRGLAERIYQLEDEAAAAEKVRAILDERKGLESQLLQLQGNTAELRRRELEALDPSNRALQRQIWAMEDAKTATDKLNEALGKLSDTDYATALDFNRARGALASGLRVVGGTDTVAPIVASVGTGSTASPMDARMEAILANINSNIALLWKQVQRWDIDGLPAVRA